MLVAVRFVAVFWTSFVVILLALPTVMPVDQNTMNCSLLSLLTHDSLLDPSLISLTRCLFCAPPC